VKLKKYFIAFLEMFGCLSYMRHTFEELDTEARTGVAKHGEKPMLEDILVRCLNGRGGLRETSHWSECLFLPQRMSVVFICCWWL
jgi:hypothetical protein